MPKFAYKNALINKKLEIPEMDISALTRAFMLLLLSKKLNLQEIEGGNSGFNTIFLKRI